MSRDESHTSRLRGALRDYDVVTLCLLAAARLVRRLGVPLRFHSYLLVAQPVADTLAPGRRRTRFETRFLERGAPELDALPRPREMLDLRFRKHARCLALFREGELAGCAWICRGSYEEDEVRCVFELAPASTTAWDFDVYIDERFRLGFAFASLWAAVNRWLAEEGVRWTLSRISTLNPASVRAHRRLGAVPLGRAIFLGLGRAQLMLSSVRPWVHVGLRPRAVPRLRLEAPEGRGETAPEA